MKYALLSTSIFLMLPGMAWCDLEVDMMTPANVAVPSGGYVGDGITYGLRIKDDDAPVNPELFLDEIQNTKDDRSPIVGRVSDPTLPNHLGAQTAGLLRIAGTFYDDFDGTITDDDQSFLGQSQLIAVWNCGPKLTPGDGIARFDSSLNVGESSYDDQKSYQVVLAGDLIGDVQNGQVAPNGVVDFADFLVLSANFGNSTNNGWTDGDMDYDGDVDFADFLVLSGNFGRTVD